MKIILHAPTIQHVRTLLAAERNQLPVNAGDVSTRGAAVIAHDVMTLVDGMLVGLMTPVCAACAEKAGGEGT